jgi:hypothetical protein
MKALEILVILTVHIVGFKKFLRSFSLTLPSIHNEDSQTHRSNSEA